MADSPSNASPGRPFRLRCPHCNHAFPQQNKNICPACAKVVLIPPALRKDAAAMRDRCIRINRARRERLGQLRDGLSLMPGRRTRMLFTLVAFVLLGVVFPLRHVLFHAHETAPAPPEVRALQNLGALRTALECYHRDCDRYPTTSEGLVALVNPMRVHGWHGPYIALLKTDPWYNDYLYRCTNEVVFLASAGPDELPNTADDILAPPPDMTYVLRPPKPVEARENGEDEFVEIILTPKKH